MGKKYLLDTHCLIWYQGDYSKIPERIIIEIQNIANVILFSQLSLIEIIIKQKTGKLPDFNASIDTVYKQALRDGSIFLNIQNHYIEAYDKVTLHQQHRDPFDRLLIAAAYEENATVITSDTKTFHFTLN